MGAETLIGYVRNGGGKNTPENQIQKDVTLDIFEETAAVKIVAGTWVDYLRVAKWNGEWEIINVLLANKPR